MARSICKRLSPRSLTGIIYNNAMRDKPERKGNLITPLQNHCKALTSADIEQTSSIETSSIVSPWLYLATYEEKKLRRLIYEDSWRVTSCGKSKQLSSCSQLIPWGQDGVQPMQQITLTITVKAVWKTGVRKLRQSGPASKRHWRKVEKTE